MQLTLLLEDPEGATIRRLAAEAHALLGERPGDVGHAMGVDVRAEHSAWIAPAPTSVRMRLFCLPYAGGVSENIFARWARCRSKKIIFSQPQHTAVQ